MFIALYFFIFVVIYASLAIIYSLYEIKFTARSQQRLGPSRIGFFGELHLFADLIKSITKNPIKRQFLLFPRLVSLILFVLPLLFGFVLLSPFRQIDGLLEGVIMLYVIILFGRAVENIQLFSHQKGIDRLLIRRRNQIALIGFLMLILASVPSLINLGTISITEFSANFKYWIMFASPFCFLSSIICFISMFYLLNESPVFNDTNCFVSGASSFFYQLRQKFWTIGIFAFWVFLYAGGGVNYENSMFDVIYLAIRVFVVATLFLFIKKSQPLIKAVDAIEIGYRYLVPLLIICIVGELFWVALIK